MTDIVRSSALSYRRRAALLLSTALAAAASPALAADEKTPAADAGDGIVVTAQRRTESLQTVPIAITAMTEAIPPRPQFRC